MPLGLTRVILRAKLVTRYRKCFKAEILHNAFEINVEGAQYRVAPSTETLYFLVSGNLPSTVHVKIRLKWEEILGVSRLNSAYLFFR